MVKTIRLVVVLAVALAAGTACKSKQKVAKIPGAEKVATSETTYSATTTAPTVVTQPTVNEPEVTRNESFRLTTGDAASMNMKYHVVVGSFKSIDNAKGLQSTLVSEGNKALVVINEQGMYRVLIASYNDYSQARTRISQISGRFSDAWVLVQK